MDFCVSVGQGMAGSLMVEWMPKCIDGPPSSGIALMLDPLFRRRFFFYKPSLH